MQKKYEFYRGKTKTVYMTDNPNLLILEFRNDTSSLDGQRIEQFERKGIINNQLNHFIMTQLAQSGIPTHMERLLSKTESLVKKLNMIPIECVIRNLAAGSLVKRLGIKEGTWLNPPIFELFWKNNMQHDPIINDSYCETFGWVSKAHLREMKQLSSQTNKILNTLFNKAQLILVDFKIEFGLLNDKVVLGDEFSPDSSRIWDKSTMDKLDKDRYRHNLGGLIEAYEKVAIRLGVSLA